MSGRGRKREKGGGRKPWRGTRTRRGGGARGRGTRGGGGEGGGESGGREPSREAFLNSFSRPGKGGEE